MYKKSFWIFIVVGMCLAWSTFLFAGRMEVDSNFDGKTDQWHHVTESGEVDKVEYDMNFNGAIDQVQFFKSGKELSRIKFDTDHNGKFDQTQYYSSKNQVDRIEKDSNNDGRSIGKNFSMRQGN